MSKAEVINEVINRCLVFVREGRTFEEYSHSDEPGFKVICATRYEIWVIANTINTFYVPKSDATKSITKASERVFQFI